MAGYVTELLRNGYREPIRLVNMYISRAIEPKFREHVGKEEQAEPEGMELEPRDTFNFKKLEKGVSSMHLTHF